MKYKGQIADFPVEIVEKMLERQVEQGNKRDVSVFEQSKYDGFDWDITPEGGQFWVEIIKNKNFDLFFEKYPKDSPVETAEPTTGKQESEKPLLCEFEKSAKLAFEHWQYIKSLLTTHKEDPETIEKIGFHYQSAFVHGYKHAKEE